MITTTWRIFWIPLAIGGDGREAGGGPAAEVAGDAAGPWPACPERLPPAAPPHAAARSAAAAADPTTYPPLHLRNVARPGPTPPTIGGAMPVLSASPSESSRLRGRCWLPEPSRPDRLSLTAQTRGRVGNRPDSAASGS